MRRRSTCSRSRRRLLLQLGSLPFATAGVVATAADRPVTPRIEDVLNIFDLEEIARGKLPAAHWAFMATGVDDDRTVAINHEAFGDYRSALTGSST